MFMLKDRFGLRPLPHSPKEPKRIQQAKQCTANPANFIKSGILVL